MSAAPVHVVGGGLAGLVAAITAAEAGAPVTLYEAGTVLGGRARSEPSPYHVNVGPHVLLLDGPLPRWLATRGLRLPTRRVPLWGNVVIDDDGVHRMVRADLARRAFAAVRDRAPDDESFLTWGTRRFGARNAADLARFAGLGLFCADPGALSAGFVWERVSRGLRRPYEVSMIQGGWSALVDLLAARAAEVGVRVEYGATLTAADLPDDGPVVVATNLSVASRLLRRPMTWTGARTALLDLAVTRRADGPAGPPVAADIRSDLRTCSMIERVTATDRSAAPAGTDVIQAQLGIGPDVALDAAVARIERGLDAAHPGWRDRERWRRSLVVTDASGALDPPGTTWRDRPAIDQGDGRFLAGDMIAAPGQLSEVSVNSAVRAAHLALERRRQASFAPGWPALRLDPDRRVEVLAGALPTHAATHTVIAAPVDEAWRVWPGDESDPYVRVRTGRFISTAIGATGDGDRTVVRAVAGTRRELPAFATAGLRLVAAWLVRRSTRR